MDELNINFAKTHEYFNSKRLNFPHHAINATNKVQIVVPFTYDKKHVGIKYKLFLATQKGLLQKTSLIL